MKQYRIMVTGEDGLVFCYDDEVTPDDLVETIKEVEEEYPCASIFVEHYDKAKENRDSWS